MPSILIAAVPVIADAYGANSQKTVRLKPMRPLRPKKTQTDAAKPDAGKADEIALSPRAQRAQENSVDGEGFFADGKFGVADIPALVSRLQKTAFYRTCNSTVYRKTVLQFRAQPRRSKQSLQDFLDDELKSLAKKSPNNP